MRSSFVIVTLLLTVAIAYYVYIPLPATINEQWKLMLLDAGLRTVIKMGDVGEWLGLGNAISLIRGSMWGLEGLKDLMEAGGLAGGGGGGVRVSEDTFGGVPVRVYEPPAGGEGQLRRAVMYYHGGGWALGSAKDGSYDVLTRQMSDELNAVVVSVEYRLAPEVLFPVPYEDCLSAAKHFLEKGVLGKYLVDPQRVAVSGDSAGGNLAAAVAQQIAIDDSVSVKFSVQALVYPALQVLDLNTPSYQQNQAIPVLYRPFMVRFWLQYLGADPAILPLLVANNHSFLHHTSITADMRARVNWSVLLPAKHRGQYRPGGGAEGSRGWVGKEVEGVGDVRVSPLLAEPAVLARCPQAYVLTCEHDVLRDDGLMYVRRLQDAGITVTSHHLDDGFHGCLSFKHFEIGKRACRGYIAWLQENL
ncbi:neutral cholesterol ester hydrolase 1a [Hypomesus transpacificus]|uniref:neutral cholesterol ester hydrolase 1a n=1 Tax=Hypomesus transpacificus TaxID=137520 RepID=UPI001F087703|nr:neutral cholesterol ester hydrolase 1a [Hypomesus transpacificus]